MSQINRVPWGLQSLLASKNFGRNPNSLMETVQPTLDQLPFLGFEILESAQALGTFTAAADVATITVPDNEVWLPLTVGASAQAVTTTEAFVLVAEIRPKNAGVTAYAPVMYVQKQDDTTRSLGRGNAITLPQPFLIGPGSEIRLRAQEVSLTSITVAITVLYYRMTV